MKLSMPLMYAGNPREAADQVSRLEKAGLDTVWVAEAYGFDSPTLMGYLAAKTETIEIGSAILNIYSRTPGALLQTAAGLDNVSGGRAILGLGASGPQVIEGFHGVPYSKPLARTAEVIDIVRRGLKREPLDHRRHLQSAADQGATARSPGSARRSRSSPAPSATPSRSTSPRLGPKSPSSRPPRSPTAGSRTCSTPRRRTSSGATRSRPGKAKRSADLEPLEINAGGMVAIGEGPETKALLDFARPIFALYVGGMGARGKNFYNDVACAYGYEKEAAEIQDLYLSGKKKEAEALVPTEWLEAANLVGPASYVQGAARRVPEAGVTNLVLTPATDDPAATIAQVKEWVS